MHKEFLQRALSGCTIEWNDLAEAIQQRKEDPKNQEFKKALENNITNVVFDRGGYIYHGKIKALAEAAREAGLEF